MSGPARKKPSAASRLAIRVVAYAAAIAISIFFVYPFYWMIVNSFRTQEAVLSRPLALLPEQFDFAAYETIANIGGVSLTTYLTNSLLITAVATALGVSIMAMGAYALYRSPKLPLFGTVRNTFLVAIMYPNMLLVIPLYFVVYYLGLLQSQAGNYVGIVLSISIVPLVFILFLQFFRNIPSELLDAAVMDGATEWQIFRRIVLPLAKPVVLTACLIAVLLNWKQWFQILVISTSPDTYTLPVALLSLNTEYGVNFQATMALATLTCVPVIIVFILTQRRVMSGFLAGAVKG